jgi:hypothetical protein
MTLDYVPTSAAFSPPRQMFAEQAWKSGGDIVGSGTLKAGTQLERPDQSVRAALTATSLMVGSPDFGTPALGGTTLSVSSPSLKVGRLRRWAANAASTATLPTDNPEDHYWAQFAERQRNQARVWMGVVERLHELRNDAESSGVPISENSLHDLWYLLRKALPGNRPSIFLLDNGNLRALWTNNKKEQVGLQFLGDGEVQFVIFVQRPNMMARNHGTESLSAMLAKIWDSGAAHLLS